MWKTAGSDRVWYSYEYDPLNRLTAANYSDAAKFNTQYTYDLNGNITRLTRSGYTAGSFAQIDDLEYLYEGNRLKTVTDLSRMREGFTDNAFIDGTDDYTYDANGNLTSDLNKSISDIEYNFLNLPEKISMQNGNRIEYSYTTTGAKLAKAVYEQDRLQSSTQYSGAFVYKDDAVSYLLFSEGRLLYEGNRTWKFEYHIEDHLGNVRVAFEPENNNKITQKNDYYPFGMQIQYNQFEAPGTNKYLYNGKEMQDEFGLDWLDYGARFYDAEIGRWHVADPLAEVAYGWTPYRYAFANPVGFFDRFGLFEEEHHLPHKNKNIDRYEIYKKWLPELDVPYIASDTKPKPPSGGQPAPGKDISGFVNQVYSPGTWEPSDPTIGHLAPDFKTLVVYMYNQSPEEEREFGAYVLQRNNKKYYYLLPRSQNFACECDFDYQKNSLKFNIDGTLYDIVVSVHTHNSCNNKSGYQGPSWEDNITSRNMKADGLVIGQSEISYLHWDKFNGSQDYFENTLGKQRIGPNTLIIYNPFKVDNTTSWLLNPGYNY